jgi:tetratricopeptide (TPR) repeat protein
MVDSDVASSHNWPIVLQEALASSFSLDELEDLCLRLGLDFEELGEGAKSRRIVNLLRWVVINGRLDDLLDQCESARPRTAVWSEIRAAAAQDPDLFDKQLTLVDDNDGDFYQLSGDFSGATIYIESTPLGDLFKSQRSRRLALGVIVVMLVLGGGGLLYSLGVFEPEPVPDTMGGDFNIAVAEFAVLDAAGQLTNSEHTGGRRLAERVAANLRQEFGDNPAVEVWVDSPELVADHHVTIGIAAEDTVAEDVAGARAPEDLTAALGADALIYGRVEPSSSLASQSLSFYLAPQFGQDFTNLVGNYVFTARIPVFDPERPAEEVWRELDPLSKALAWLLLGLRQERIGEPAQALASFERARSFVPDADIVHYFIGQENLFLAQKSEGEATLTYESAAEAAFNEALRLNPDNARAIIGLGGVQTLRAQRLLVEGRAPSFDGDAAAMFTAAQSEARRALETYEPVAEQPEQIETYGVPVRSIARLGQGIALRILGDAAYRAGDPAAARQAITQAIETLETAVAPLEEARDYRLMAQLVQALGTVYEWQGFLDQQAADPAATAAYEQALTYYTQCRDLGEAFPIDVYLTDRIVDQLCLPRIEALQATTGGTP